MTDLQFDTIALLISSRGPASAAARLVLVQGVRPSEAARRLEVSPSRCSDTVRRVRAADQAIRAAYGCEQQGDPQ